MDFIRLFCITLLFFCVSNANNTTLQNNEHLDTLNVFKDTYTEWIVKWKSMLLKEEAEDLLHRILSHFNALSWQLMHRNNPSYLLPSDFTLIFKEEQQRAILETLQSSSDVKYVFPQKRFTASNLLSSAMKEQEEEEGVYHPITEQQLALNMSGRTHTKFSMESEYYHTMRKLQGNEQLVEMMDVEKLWQKGYTGAGVKVAVFDTGLKAAHPHFKRVMDITNWTDEDTSDDSIGHGTFVAGVIASDSECLGIAPDVQLHIFRVFTNSRVSYTSWFLDAFNYAIHSGIDILNLSIGGPDFMDRPFVEKVWELSANNIIVVSAIGNDGTLYGTLNNPADQLDVIGVGGIDYSHKLAPFSSRGMTTWELPEGYGRVKPDVLAYGQNVAGSRIYGGCRTLSGTSVASPVVAGSIALLSSSLPVEKRQQLVNPASMKQILLETSDRLVDLNIFEQGAGKINLQRAVTALQEYTPRASCYPSAVDLAKCPYMWPYCTQPLYYGALPVIVNVTVLNGMGVAGEISAAPEWKAAQNGDKLEISFTYSELLWPWSGYLALHLRAHADASQWEGDVEGKVVFTVTSPPGVGELTPRNTTIELPVKVHIIPTPPRHKRLLWDQYHNLRYPSGYFPRDSLELKDEPFDWNGDHIHTNFRELYTHLRNRGYFIEVLGKPFTCFDASQYGALLIVDPEEEFFPAEIEKLKNDVEHEGLSLLVFADWYNVELIKQLNFYDDNTHQWWVPVTGGCNVPALNALLEKWGIAFGDRVYHGDFAVNHKDSVYMSGTHLIRFPAAGSVAAFSLSDKTAEIISGRSAVNTAAVLGLYPAPAASPTAPSTQHGRIAVFGDSSCLDSAAKTQKTCFWLMDELLQYTSTGFLSAASFKLKTFTAAEETALPTRLEGNTLYKHSKVIGHSAHCTKLDFKRYNNTLTEHIEIVWPDESEQVEHSGKFIEQSLSRAGSSRAVSSDMSGVVPYVIGGVGVFGLILLYFKLQRERSIGVLQMKRAQSV